MSIQQKQLGRTEARLDLSVGRFRLPLEKVVEQIHEVSDAAVFPRNIKPSTPPGAEAQIDECTAARQHIAAKKPTAQSQRFLDHPC